MIVNGNAREWTENLTIALLLNQYNINREHVVVEHNGVILSPGEFDATLIDQRDTIEIIGFVGGG